MSVITSQQISKYYDKYRDITVTFTKAVVKDLCLDTRQVYIKCLDAQWPCIISSTTFTQAKVLVGTKSGAAEGLAKNTGSINLRFRFTQADKQPISFYISCKVSSITPYMDSQDLMLVSLSFTQRPPDDLIQIIGGMLEANYNFMQFRNNWVVLSDDIKRKIGISDKKTIITIQGVPRHCILREISFCGVKVFLQGLTQFLEKKDAVLSIEFDDLSALVSIRGTIDHCLAVEGRKDIAVVSLSFLEEAIPLSYKLRLSNYINSSFKVSPAGE